MCKTPQLVLRSCVQRCDVILLCFPAGFVDAPLVDTVDVVRVGESELGNAICDAMAWQLGRSMVLRRPVCLINAGMMRAGLHAGNITTGDVLEVLPFGTLTSVLNITGADVSVLEREQQSGMAVPAWR